MSSVIAPCRHTETQSPSPRQPQAHSLPPPLTTAAARQVDKPDVARA